MDSALGEEYRRGRRTARAPLLLPTLLVPLALLAGACAARGPAALQDGRTAYNVAGQVTANEQLLLNLVRLRYRDTPFFLELSAVSASYTWEGTAGASGGLEEGGPGTLGLEGSVRLAEEPTISYTPLQGEDFVRQLLAPIELEIVLLLYHSGWAVDRILGVCVQRMNGLRNAPSASGPTPSAEPVFREFLEAARALRHLQRAGLLVLGRTEDGQGLALDVAPGAEGSPELHRFTDLLGLPPGRGRYHIAAGMAPSGGEELVLQTRSLMAALFYVSHSVLVPGEDEEAGRVTVTRAEDGARFDWSELTGRLIKIHSGSSRPDNTFLAVPYRGSWFYLDDSDLDSKSTFSLLMQLFALQAGEVRSRAPLLTLPVRR